MKVIGHVRGLSSHYVEDGLERVEIWVQKEDARGLPYELDKRIPIELIIKNETFLAGLRATEKTPYVWISPDLLDAKRQKISLAKVLNKWGVSKNQEILLQVDKEQITLIA